MSPASTSSLLLASCISVAPQSGPGGNNLTSLQRQQQQQHHNQRHQQQRLDDHHQQQQQHQFTAQLFLNSTNSFLQQHKSNSSGGGVNSQGRRGSITQGVGNRNSSIPSASSSSTTSGGGDRTDMKKCSTLGGSSGNAAGSIGMVTGLSGGTSSTYLLPCPLCDLPLKPQLFRQHLDRHYPRDSPVCPVMQCGRRFAHPNSVRNHMRLKHTLQWAKMKAMRSSGGPFSGIPDFK